MCKKLPSEATFSRAFEAFSDGKLAERVHEVLIKSYLGDELIGHLSRDGTAIHARERPARSATTVAAAQPDLHSTETKMVVSSVESPAPTNCRGRSRRGEIRSSAVTVN